MNINDVKKIAVLGSGAMGHGIAQVCIQAGVAVVMRDIKQEFIDNGVAKIKESLDFLVGKGKMQAADMQKAMSLLTTTLDTKAAVADAQIIVEAVPEIMDLKKSVFKEVSDACKPDVILATNTSTMSISEIGSVVKKSRALRRSSLLQPGQPDEAGRGHLREQDQRRDRRPDVRARQEDRQDPGEGSQGPPRLHRKPDQRAEPGPLSAILDEGKVPPQQLDATMKKMGAKMAPFETADFVGLDVFCHTLDYYAKTLSPQYKPGKYLTDKVSKKELGMKSGKGIYDWKDGKAVIDISTTSTDLSPIHLLAVQVNEAVKVWKEGLAKSIQDIDDGVKFGMNAFAGPFALAAGMQPQQLTDALNMLAARFKLDILKPEPEIVDGTFKTIGR